jgi:hypothetical protein
MIETASAAIWQNDVNVQGTRDTTTTASIGSIATESMKYGRRRSERMDGSIKNPKQPKR